MLIEGNYTISTLLGIEGIQIGVRCRTSVQKECTQEQWHTHMKPHIIQGDAAWGPKVCRCEKEQPDLIWGIREENIHPEGHFLAHAGYCLIHIPPLRNWVAQATFTCEPNWGHIHLICFISLAYGSQPSSRFTSTAKFHPVISERSLNKLWNLWASVYSSVKW